MREAFQRLFMMSEPEILPLNAQAALGAVRVPRRSQFSLLVRLFLERFFNHETASPDGDGKTRLVLLAISASLPGFVVALYFWPIYHPFRGWPPGSKAIGPPPYWVQMNHHFFFVLYSFVVMGLITVFEWDLFFPDQLDVLVLTPLPLRSATVFRARVAAIAILIFGFLFDANLLAPFALPAATDPPNLTRFLAGHLAAVSLAGLFASATVIAIQGVLLALLGESFVRKLSLALQALVVTVLVVLLLLFPVISGITPALLQSGSRAVLWFPPFWFLGVDQDLLGGTGALPIFHTLALRACLATLLVCAVAVVAYPLAYLRRVRRLVEGGSARTHRNPFVRPIQAVLHATVVRPPVRRAAFHFISQTLFRVPRYRIHLVLYGGFGLSVLIASVLRLTIDHHHAIHASVSADGIRTSIGIVAFWVVAGLRTTFLAPGNERGTWVLRIVHGNPPSFRAALDLLLAARVWALLCSLTVTATAIAVLHLFAPPELSTPLSLAAQLLTGAGLCLLLVDAAFARVTAIAFTGERPRDESVQTGLAFTVLRFATFFPLVTAIALAAEYFIEHSWQHFGLAAVCITAAHLWLRHQHRGMVRLHSSQLPLEEGEDDFPMRLGLRY
jgi:hypothetical protein